MTRRPTREDPRIGLVLDDKYELVEGIGRGGLATVYRGKRLDGGPDVAVKVLTSLDRSGENTKIYRMKRFNREALAISALKHINTVRLLDFGATPNGVPYMVLELIDGFSLHELIRQQGRIKPVETCRIARRVCYALAEAHSHGIVHRDIKPSNIMLVDTPEGRLVKVVDFGAVRLNRAVHEAMTDAGMTLGSAPYMSPEQTRAHELTPASDLYSLGITIYEALTGDIPFRGDYGELVSQHCFSDPPVLNLPDEDPRIVAGWQALLNALLAKDPKDRPPSAVEAARVLKVLDEPPRSFPWLWVGVGAAVATVGAVVAAAVL